MAFQQLPQRRDLLEILGRDRRDLEAPLPFGTTGPSRRSQRNRVSRDNMPRISSGSAAPMSNRTMVAAA
ncbi:hypothetical protein [Mesorhizobium sp. B2-1-8]|uniref:hypothetical protein n=1 Tax=Mesorhizobium sp. B2-1-8 TaxID=2589967 RepID=UPI0015E2EB3E|nr:hypothetical protein [Mesorhizobium sp. B2-1-8]